MIRCHSTVLASLQHPSTWGALSVPLWTFAGTLTSHTWQTALYGLATACSMLAIILAPPRDEHHDQQEDH